MQKDVEQKRIAVETEKLRSTEFSKAHVQAETDIKIAEGQALALRLKEEAELFAQQKEADGILAIFEAQSSGIQKLIDSFGGNREGLMQYLMMDKGGDKRLGDA